MFGTARNYLLLLCGFLKARYYSNAVSQFFLASTAGDSVKLLQGVQEPVAQAIFFACREDFARYVGASGARPRAERRSALRVWLRPEAALG
jgi:hypothetical protein